MNLPCRLTDRSPSEFARYRRLPPRCVSRSGSRRCRPRPSRCRVDTESAPSGSRCRIYRPASASNTPARSARPAAPAWQPTEPSRSVGNPDVAAGATGIPAVEVNPGRRHRQRFDIPPDAEVIRGPPDLISLTLRQPLADVKGNADIVLRLQAVAALPDSFKRITDRNRRAVGAAGGVPGFHRRGRRPENRGPAGTAELPD